MVYIISPEGLTAVDEHVDNTVTINRFVSCRDVVPVASHDQPSKNKSGTHCTLTPSSPAPSSSAPIWGHDMFFCPYGPFL